MTDQMFFENRMDEMNPPVNESQIIGFLKIMQQRLKEGDMLPYKALAILKRIEQYFDVAMEIGKELVKKEIAENNSKLEIEGFRFSFSSGGRWDYSKVKEWNLLNSQKTALENKLKSFAKLKESNPEIELVDESTGEIMSDLPEYKPNEQGVKIEFLR